MSRYDYAPLRAAIIRRVQEEFGDEIFTIVDLYPLGQKFNAPKHIIKNALAYLVKSENIIKVGITIAVRGGSQPTTYRLINTDLEPIKKGSSDHQLEAKVRANRMHECALRLARAMGLPIGRSA